MLLAHIPPIPNLGDFESTGIHLVLAHLFNDQHYIDHYRQRSNAGDFVILDNGAHEGSALSLREVFHRAIEVRAHEVVMPDVHMDPQRTWIEFRHALRWLTQTATGESAWEAAGCPRLMFVPQASPKGENPTDRLLAMLTDMHKCVGDQSVVPLEHFTIGLPLMYDLPPFKGLLRVLESATWLTEYSGMKIHLLGWSRNLTTPKLAAHTFPGVRSCDTAKPFVYARAGIKLKSLETRMEYPSRSDDYFTKELTPKEVELANFNLRTFLDGVTLPSLHQRGEGLQATEGQEAPGDRARLPDDVGSEEGSTTRG